MQPIFHCNRMKRLKDRISQHGVSICAGTTHVFRDSGHRHLDGCLQLMMTIDTANLRRGVRSISESDNHMYAVERGVGKPFGFFQQCANFAFYCRQFLGNATRSPLDQGNTTNQKPVLFAHVIALAVSIRAQFAGYSWALSELTCRREPDAKSVTRARQRTGPAQVAVQRDPVAPARRPFQSHDQSRPVCSLPYRLGIPPSLRSRCWRKRGNFSDPLNLQFPPPTMIGAGSQCFQ